jgi:glucosamine--fructose-6-phosphate aminotransferase (isomerizing)
VSRFHDEIREQPEVAARLIEQSRPAVDAIGARYRDLRPRGFVIAARGSSDHAALYAKYLFGRRNRALVALAAPSLFTRYASPPLLDGQCVIGISQSGASPDVLAVLEEAVRQGAMTVAITNEPDSKMASVAELVLPLHAGPERSVPASKTYTASLLALALISNAIDRDDEFESALARVPASMAAALKAEIDLDTLVPALAGSRAIVLARGFNFSTAEEIALKLTETSYVLARAWSVADFEHGPIAVVEPGFPVLLVGGGGSVEADLQAICARLVDYGCRVIGLFDGASAPRGLDAAVNHDSGLPEELTPLTLAVLGQLLAHRVAVARGVDPDQPRALHKITRTW